MSSDHDNSGKFAKGNKASSKILTKRNAKKMINSELERACELLTQVDVIELKNMQANRSLQKESLMTYVLISSALKGSLDPVKWLAEMSVGKSVQQVEQNSTGSIQINIDKDDIKL